MIPMHRDRERSDLWDCVRRRQALKVWQNLQSIVLKIYTDILLYLSVEFRSSLVININANAVQRGREGEVDTKTSANFL